MRVKWEMLCLSKEAAFAVLARQQECGQLMSEETLRRFRDAIGELDLTPGPDCPADHCIVHDVILVVKLSYERTLVKREDFDPHLRRYWFNDHDSEEISVGVEYVARAIFRAAEMAA